MRGFLKRLSVAAALLIPILSGCAALAQGAIQQSGAVVPFHPGGWLSNGTLIDGGGVNNPSLNAVGLFNGAGCPFGISSQTGPGAVSTPHSQFSICQTASSTTFNFSGLNGQANPSVFFNIGGVLYPVTGGGGGGGSGTVTSLTGGNGINLAPTTITTTGVISVDPAVVPIKGGINVYTGSNTFSGTFVAPACTGTVAGLVPATTPSGKFLSDNCTWQTAAGTGTVTSIGVSGGSTGLTTSGGPVTGSGTITIGGTLNVANGGTGQTTSAAAINTLVPSQSGQSGKVLGTNGATVNWVTTSGTGLYTVFDVVNSYGGDPTNTNANDTPLDNANTACNAAGGGIIYFGAGTYKFTATHTIADPCSVVGASAKSTILKPTGISGNFMTTGTGAFGVDFHDFQIANGGSWTSGFGLNVGGSWSRYHDIWIVGTPQAVYHSAGSDIWFDHNEFQNQTASPIVQCDSGRGQIFGARWSNTNMSESQGVGFQQGADCNTLTFNNVDTVGVDTCFLGQTGISAGVVMDDFECDGDVHGVIINGGAGIQITNSFFGDASAGSGITFGSSYNSWATLTNNTIRDNMGFGILVNGSAGVTITGNVISGNRSFASFTGAISGTTLTATSITGSIVAGQVVSGSGVTGGTIILSGSGSTWVVNNSQSVGSEAMTSIGGGDIAVGAGVSNFSITGNQLQVPGLFDPTSPWGVIVVSGSSNYYSITNNICASTATVCVSDGGSGAKKFVSGNVGP